MRFLLWLKVHIGFYSSYNNTVLRSAITNAVRKARKLHGHSDIIVTGHSMGGAIASFCALDLAVSDPQILNIYFFAQGSIFTAQGVTIGGMECFFFPPWSLKRFPHLQMSFGSNNVHLMTFGQPRVGNAAFASYFAKYVPKTIRMTHERDIVPHLPPYFFFLPKLTYKHFPREVRSWTTIGHVLCWVLNTTTNSLIILLCLPLCIELKGWTGWLFAWQNVNLSEHQLLPKWHEHPHNMLTQ